MAMVTDLRIDDIRLAEQIRPGLFALWIVALSGILYPETGFSQFTPRLFTGVSIVEQEGAGVVDSGHVTTVSPGISFSNRGASADISIDYQYNFHTYSGFDRSDQDDHELLVSSRFDHIADRWVSEVTASVSEENTVAGRSVLELDNLNLISETRDLETLGIESTYRGIAAQDVRFTTYANAGTARYDDEDPANDLGIGSTIGTTETGNRFTWNIALELHRYNQDEVYQDISSFSTAFYYRWSRKYAAFLRTETSNTDDDELDETNTTIGIRWNPNRNSNFELGVGKRGDQTTYSMDSLITTGRIRLIANYQEQITTSSALTVESESGNLNVDNLSQSLSITPLLVKTGFFSISLNGNRTTLALNHNLQRNFFDSPGDEEEISRTSSLVLTRSLSSNSQFQGTLSKNEIDEVVSVDNTSTEQIRLTYTRRLGRDAQLQAGVSRTEQDLEQDRGYSQQILDMSYTMSF